MDDIAIVVPVKDEEMTIKPLIDSIAGQTLLPKEVIFVDGGSADSTKKIIRENIALHPFEIKLIETEKSYPGEARNAGVSESACQLVAFTDAGIRLDSRWLEELMRPMRKDEKIEAVYGAYEPIVDSFIKECSLIAYVPPKEEIDGRRFRTNFIASSLFRKRVFEKVGGFPPFRAAEDRIFMEKVRASGAKTAYTDKAVVYWEIPGSVKSIFARFREFSAHDMLAGRAKDWHYSVFRTYGLLLFCFLTGILVNPVFILCVPAVLILRFVRIILRKKKDVKPGVILSMRHILTIFFIILVTDAALFSGVLKYLFLRR